MSRVARAGVVVAAALALLVVLYAAAGWWLAPRYVRDALVDAAAQRGLALELAQVETRPFVLQVALGGIALRDRQGAWRAQADSALADLAWSSLWRPGWILQDVRLEGGRVHLGAQDLSVEAIRFYAQDLSTQPAAEGRYEATARLAEGGELASRGTLTLEPLAAEGTLRVAELPLAQRVPGARGTLQGTAQFAFSEGALVLTDVSMSAADLAYAGLEVPQATLKAEEVPIPPEGPVKVSAQAELAPQGRIEAQGSVAVDPVRVELRVRAERLPLAEAERWLPETMKLRIASGAVSGSGAVQAGAGDFAYQGSVAIDALRLEERDSDALLLAWQQAKTGSLRFRLSPLEIEAGEIVARAPEGRLVIEKDGRVNFAEAFGAGGEADDADGKLQARVERLRIEEGTLHFADRSLATPFEATIVGLAGTLSGFSTAPGEPARVRLDGRVQPYGVARIRGTIDLDAPASLADITATFRNLRLQAFNPYVVKFAGYRIDAGRLTAKLRYEVREGRLSGTNDLAFENLKLGEKVEQKGLLDLPLELAVALLADAKGRIDLDIPVRGNLRDPKFDLGALVAQALGNTVKKIVTAPFRALAGLLRGKDDDPGTVVFAAGSAALSPPAEEKLAELAEALRQRPRLALTVRGGFDAEEDRAALRLAEAREALARAAGVEAPLDFADPKVVRAAEALYLERGGDRAGLAALRKTEARYARLLLHRVAAAQPVDGNAARALAAERAERVRSALLSHGVDPARVRVEEAAEQEASGRGVPTALALTAG